MQPAPSLDYEPERLAALARYDIFDTAHEEVFDDIVALASHICQTPMAIVSLVAGVRLWFKAKKGTDLSETPRDISFCGHAIAGTGIFEVPDAVLDPRFADNPYVTGAPHCRFYAGAPLMTTDGHALGTLCVLDDKPATLSVSQREALAALARHTMNLINLRVRNHEISSEAVQIRALQAELEKNNARLRLLFDEAPMGICEISREARFLDVNHAFARFINRPREQLIGASLFSVMHPEDMPPLPLDLDSFPTNAEPIRGRRLRYLRPDGTVVWGEVTVRLLDIGGVRCQLAIVEDVTEKRLQEHSLLNASKMSALGEMAGSIAHEINNPLTIISGFAQTLREQLKDAGVAPEIFRSQIERIIKTADRIANIVRGMRQFSRSAEDDALVLVPIATIIADTLALCGERFRMGHVQVKVISTNSDNLLCRPAQISQVLLNMLNNSFEAVRGLPEKWVEIDTRRSGQMLQLRVTDSGPGIPEPMRTRMMEPFFTTKVLGGGTGLGLSASAGIAESHGGVLRYDADSAHTSFVLNLPGADAATSSAS